MFLANLRQFLLVFRQFLGILVPLGTPLVPQGCDAIDEEGVELLVRFLVNVGKLRDVSPQDLQFLLDDFSLASHGRDHLGQAVDVTADGEVHGHLLLLLAQHRK